VASFPRRSSRRVAMRACVGRGAQRCRDRCGPRHRGSTWVNAGHAVLGVVPFAFPGAVRSGPFCGSGWALVPPPRDPLSIASPCGSARDETAARSDNVRRA
jgi:hypothetical protein